MSKNSRESETDHTCMCKYMYCLIYIYMSMTNTFKAVTAYFKQSIQTDGQAVRQLDRRTVRKTDKPTIYDLKEIFNAAPCI